MEDKSLIAEPKSIDDCVVESMLDAGVQWATEPEPYQRDYIERNIDAQLSYCIGTSRIERNDYAWYYQVFNDMRETYDGEGRIE